MALIESLGYKQDSTPQRRKASRQESLLTDFSDGRLGMTPYGVQMGSSAASAAQENSHLLSNRPRMQRAQSYTHSNARSSKYGALPTKSLRSSGIGAVSPMPKRLEMSHADCTMPMPISPIRASEALQQSQASHFVAHSQSHSQLNSTLNLSHAAQQQQQQAQYEAQVTIIGFPPSEAAFIHRKFGSYGAVLNSEWSDNALFVEYENGQNAQRALAENAKWISNGNERYMIAVMYAERTELNGVDANSKAKGNGHNHRGRFLSLAPDNGSLAGVRTQHRHYANVEKAPAIQFGPTHILWKVFNFVTSGW